jgi:hypothetical protein
MSQQITRIVNNGQAQLEEIPLLAPSPFMSAMFPDLDGLTASGSEQVEALPPTMAVLWGGSGIRIGVYLKAALTSRFGDTWQERVRILAFDTTHDPVAVQLGERLIQLDPGVEFFNIGKVPVPNIIRNLDNLTSINERLGTVLPNLPPTVLRHGAKQYRVLGLLAFLWHYDLIAGNLRKTIWSLAGRDLAGSQDTADIAQGIGIYCAGSLAGGSGAGMLLDGAVLIRSLLDDLGTQSDFCRLVGLGILPRAFPGIPSENLNANTAASLEEINHLMTEGGFQARYPDGRIINLQHPPFDIFHVVDGIDERGQTWSGINEVAAMAAEGIFLQIASQLGRRQDNAFTNEDVILAGRTADGEGTFLSTIGLGTLEFPAPAVADYCAGQLLKNLIHEEWLSPVNEEGVQDQAKQRLSQVTAARLAAALNQDETTGGEIRIDLHLPSWLLEKKMDEVAVEASRYIQEYHHSRVLETILPRIRQRGAALYEAERAHWETWLNENLFTPGSSIGQISAVLNSSRRKLARWSGDIRQDVNGLDEYCEKQKVAVTQLVNSVSQAAGSLYFGRNGRVRDALTQTFQAAQDWFEAQVARAVLQAQLAVWHELGQTLSQWEQQLQTSADHLNAIGALIEGMSRKEMQKLEGGGVSRMSLAGEEYVKKLYARHVPLQVNLFSLPAVAGASLTPLALTQMDRRDLMRLLLSALREEFAAIYQMNIEDVIQERHDEMTPRAWRQQLSRLATPSWNINRARLPEGGAGLVRFEVLGVPNESRTIYDDEILRVSTHDPYRLVALVMVAGAPPSALQQYDLYQQCLARVRANRPSHVLPDFVADADQGRLAFALGSIFGLVSNHGTHFFYQPADPIEPAVRLGNGLPNALRELTVRDGLVREIIERVEGQIARQGLQQTIELLTAYYTAVPSGRTAVDEINRTMKRLVRDYVAELQQIDEFHSGLQ